MGAVQIEIMTNRMPRGEAGLLIQYLIKQPLVGHLCVSMQFVLIAFVYGYTFNAILLSFQNMS